MIRREHEVDGAKVHLEFRAAVATHRKFLYPQTINQTVRQQSVRGGSMSTKKRSFWSSFEIVDRESCARAVRNGVIAAAISAVLTAVLGVAGFFAQSSGLEVSYLFDPWILLDVPVIVLLAVFTSRKSRIASTLLVIYFVASKVITWSAIGVPKGAIVAVIFFLYYFTAMRATYLWHSTYQHETTAVLPPHHSVPERYR